MKKRSTARRPGGGWTLTCSRCDSTEDFEDGEYACDPNSDGWRMVPDGLVRETQEDDFTVICTACLKSLWEWFDD